MSHTEIAPRPSVMDRIGMALASIRDWLDERGKAAWIVEASDGSADGRGKLLALAGHMSPPPKVCGTFSADDLSLALGLENAIHAVLLEGGRADRWTIEVERLAGFRPLLPPEWGGELAEAPNKVLDGRGSAP